jgi:hypothetical protein
MISFDVSCDGYINYKIAFAAKRRVTPCYLHDLLSLKVVTVSDARAEISHSDEVKP